MLTAEELARGQAQAQELIAEVNQRLVDQLARQADEARNQLHDGIEKRAEQRAKVGGAQGDAEYNARIAEIDELSQAGFGSEAHAKRIDLLADVTNRSGDFGEQAAQSTADAGLVTGSRLEAVAGLGQNTFDEQLVKKAEEAEKQRQEQTDKLSALLAVLKGEA